ncbi:MAG TPA: glycosyl hydrolase family 28-related protein [Geminicoccaceae bacterium]|nr:glycosyl hydrolase family 28-related protein [Geminicoccus sp.]HMU52770.1 glycosyl hydrolase family 28-related protein [Geminicoccaceae bacterium]
MANMQIHELAPAATLAAGDQMLVSTAGNLTRRAPLGSLPFSPPRAGAVARTIAGKLGETASARDFGAVGDGVADDTAAIAAALASGARCVVLPEGVYKVTAPLAAPVKTGVLGAGRDATILRVAHNGYGLSWSGAEYVDGAVDGLRIELPATSTAAAIRCRGNNFRASDLRVAGGGAGAWGIELDQCNDFSVSDVLMWGDGTDAFAANGIWIRNSTPAAVNYGDGTLTQISIRLGSDNTKALFLDGPTNGNIINNILIAKATIHATGRTGCRGVHIRNGRRLTFVSVDLENIAEGVFEEGTAGDRTEMNQYIGVFALNVTTAYADSNGSIGRSVFNRLFLGCDNFPALSGFADGDSMIQRGIWLPSWSSGQPLARLIEHNGYCRIDRGETGAYVYLGGNPTGNNSRLTSGAVGASANSVTLYLGDSTLQRVSFDAPPHIGDRMAAPPGATDNMLAFADGSTWNPGFEKGLYSRASSSWYRLVDTRMRGWVMVNEQTGTSYTLQAGDLGDKVEMVGTSPKTVTVPQMATVPGSTKAPGLGTIVSGRKVYVETTVVQSGSGAVNLSPASGVTITGPTATSGDGQSLVLRWTSATAVRSKLVA